MWVGCVECHGVKPRRRLVTVARPMRILRMASVSSTSKLAVGRGVRLCRMQKPLETPQDTAVVSENDGCNPV